MKRAITAHSVKRRSPPQRRDGCVPNETLNYENGDPACLAAGAIACGRERASARADASAVTGPCGIDVEIVLRADLVLMSGDVERRIEKQSIGRSIRFGEIAEPDRPAGNRIEFAASQLLADIGDLTQRSVRIRRQRIIEV